MASPTRSSSRLARGLEELRKRVKSGYGKFDAQSAQELMCRPVAMNSNLHNVLFVPEDGVLYIANADHKSPAADRPYVKLDLNELLKTMPVRLSRREREEETVHIKPKIAIDAQFAAIDTLNLREESRDDAKQCLDGLKWIPSDFAVRIEAAQENCGDCWYDFHQRGLAAMQPTTVWPWNGIRPKTRIAIQSTLRAA